MKTIKILFLFVFFLSVNLISAQNSLHFDGSNDYIGTTMPSITGSSARTIEAWVNITANSNPSTGGGQHIIADMGTFSTGSRFTFCVLWANAIRLEVQGSGLSGTIAINDGSWHHVAAVYDPTATNKIKLYVDGVLDTEGNIATAVNTTAGSLQIGRRVDMVNNFEGKIDELRVWDVAKSVTDLVALKDIEFCGGQTNLKAYYKFNQGVASGSNTSVSSLSDFSGNSYTGTLYSFSLSGSTSNWVSGATLTAGAGTTSSIFITECDSYTSPSGNYTWVTNGIYTDTIPNLLGCDSIITINLTIKNSTTSTITETACSSYTSPSGNHVWSATGVYTDVIQNASGCDSVITINLTIENVDVSVTQTGVQLQANATGVNYQWIDCAGNTDINGATNQIFTPTVDGNYAVIVSSSNCSDTSICYQVVGVGINNLDYSESIVLFPNPCSDFINIELKGSFKISTISITDLSGRIVLHSEHNNVSDAKVDISFLTSGVYIVRVGDATNEKLLKLLVE
ncbi:MAG: T9SS type A sorting domain-containing protein [Bacteroidales bacterium]|nr:T9SS type A sorting domain-containing protein [Bacteroidales bacterium]